MAAATKKATESNDAPRAAKIATKPKTPAPKVATKNAVVPHRPQSVPQTLLATIMRASTDKTVDSAKMRELLTMAREEEARAAEKAFWGAFHALQGDLYENAQIIKDAFNDHTKSRYPKLEQIATKVFPIVHRHQFDMSWGTADSPLDDHYRVICDLVHIPSGFKRRYEADIGSDTVGAKGGGTKSGAQGSGSSLSYGRRYLTVLIFNLVVAGEDVDAQGKPRGSLNEKQFAQLIELMHDRGITEEKFVAAFLCKPKELPARRFEEAIGRLTAAPARKTKPEQETT